MSYVFKSIIAATFMSLATVASAEKLSLNEISGYLNTLKTASGDFTQINEDGTLSVGKIFIKRPGRMRLEYDDALVLASSGSIKIVDKKSNLPPESYALRRTPLSLILARNVDLGQAEMVVGHGYDGTATSVQVQDPKNPEYGSIELKFTSNPVELRQWIVNDSNGGHSTVILGELVKGGVLANKLFEIDPQ
jgi:outer membrane lipoprotein-sorting protein